MYIQFDTRISYSSGRVEYMYIYSRQQQQQYIIEHPPLIADVASLAPLYIQCVLRSSWLGGIYPSSFPFLGGDGMAERERK